MTYLLSQAAEALRLAEALPCCHHPEEELTLLADFHGSFMEGLLAFGVLFTPRDINNSVLFYVIYSKRRQYSSTQTYARQFSEHAHKVNRFHFASIRCFHVKHIS